MISPSKFDYFRFFSFHKIVFISFFSHENTESAANQPTVTVLMDSLSGKIIRIRVAKKPDKINEHLLVDPKDTEEKSMWKSLAKFVCNNMLPIMF